MRQSRREQKVRNIPIGDDLHAQVWERGRDEGYTSFSECVRAALRDWVRGRGRGAPHPPPPSSRAKGSE